MEHLLVVGSVHALFTALFLMTKRARNLNDVVLATWMVFMALPFIAGATAQAWPEKHIPILRADLIYPLTYGPFMWLYVGALTGDVVRITRRHLLHFLPFAAVSIFQLLTGWALDPPNPQSATFSTSIRVVGAVNLVVLLGYSAAVFWRLARHDRQVLGHFSNLPNHITLGWLRWMTAGMTGVFLLMFLAAFLSIPSLLVFHLIALVASILILSFFGLRQDQVFDAADHPGKTLHSPDVIGSPASSGNDKPRYDRSGLTPDRAQVIAERLERFMRTKQPYLDADLTIEALAKHMAVPRHHLTEVVNEHHQKNFYLFVNEFRIQAVKQALKDPARTNETLLDIAFACGFNSKSPFNTAFKQLTGVTPSQYRRQPH
jgi:AraC-like DNA-binding protein